MLLLNLTPKLIKLAFRFSEAETSSPNLNFCVHANCKSYDLNRLTVSHNSFTYPELQVR